MAWQDWVPSLTTATTVSALWGGFFYFARIRWEKSIQSKLDAKLERLKSQLRLDEENIRSQLRARELDIQSLRSGALSNMATRRADLSKRRQQSAEVLWSAVMELRPYKTATNASQSIKLDRLMEVAAGHGSEAEAARKFAQAPLLISNLTEIAPLKVNPDAERPFLSPVVWALFNAYRLMVLHAPVTLLASTKGIPPKFFADPEKLIEIAKAALPHHAKSFDKSGVWFITFLVDELEEKILRALVDDLNGVEVELSAIKDAEALMERVRESTTSGVAR